jgi:hypothetical protein
LGPCRTKESVDYAHIQDRIGDTPFERLLAEDRAGEGIAL